MYQLTQKTALHYKYVSITFQLNVTKAVCVIHVWKHVKTLLPFQAEHWEITEIFESPFRLFSGSVRFPFQASRLRCFQDFVFTLCSAEKCVLSGSVDTLSGAVDKTGTLCFTATFWISFAVRIIPVQKARV